MKKTTQNIHRTCISHASAIREKLEASEAEVARLRKEVLQIVGEFAFTANNLLHEKVHEYERYDKELAKSKSKVREASKGADLAEEERRSRPNDEKAYEQYLDDQANGK